MGDISRNFSKHEFECKCGCGKSNPTIELVATLQDMRDYIKSATGKDMPIVINSGVRCDKHNKDVNGADQSAHLTGEAADIAVSSSYERYWILKAAMIIGVKRVAVEDGFIHIDVSKTLAQEVTWVY